MEETRLDCAGYPCSYCMEANSGTWDGLVSLHLREREEWGPGWRRLDEGHLNPWVCEGRDATRIGTCLSPYDVPRSVRSERVENVEGSGVLVDFFRLEGGEPVESWHGGAVAFRLGKHSYRVHRFLVEDDGTGPEGMALSAWSAVSALERKPPHPRRRGHYGVIRQVLEEEGDWLFRAWVVA